MLERRHLNKDFGPEGLDAQRRYLSASAIGQDVLRDTALVEETKPWSLEDIKRTKEFLLKVAPLTHPRLYPNYWDHLLLTSIYGQKIAEKANLEELQPQEAAVLGLTHDLGKTIVPHRYLRTNLVETRFAQRIGIRPELTEKNPPIPAILGLGKHPVLTLDDLSFAQRIMDVADNLGKLNRDGSLFDVKQISGYAAGQSGRYRNTLWPSEKRGIKALEQGKQALAITLVIKEIEWLEKNYKIDFTALREEVLQEFQKPENQNWLLQARNAQENLNPKFDELLGRPPVKTVIFDFGDVLTAGGLDEKLIAAMAKVVESPAETVSTALGAILGQGALSAVLKEEEYLERFFKALGKPFPGIEKAKTVFMQPEIYEPCPGMPKILASLSQNPNIAIYVLSDAVAFLAGPIRKAIQENYPQIPMDHVYISSERKVAKSENRADFWQKVLELVGNPDPSSVLFIDNNEVYTTSARAVGGIRGLTFRGDPDSNLSPETRLEKEFAQAGLISSSLET